MLWWCLEVSSHYLTVSTISGGHGNFICDAVFNDLVLEPFQIVSVFVAKVRWTNFKVNFSPTTLFVPGKIHVCVRLGIKIRLIFQTSINALLGVVCQAKRPRCYWRRLQLPPPWTRVIVIGTCQLLHVACFGAGETSTLHEAHRAEINV